MIYSQLATKHETNFRFLLADDEDDDESSDVIESGLTVVEAEKIEESEGLQDRIKQATDQV